jgi:hypothetical protein
MIFQLLVAAPVTKIASPAFSSLKMAPSRSIMGTCWKDCVRLVRLGGLRRDPGWPCANCDMIAVRMRLRHVICSASVMNAQLRPIGFT